MRDMSVSPGLNPRNEHSRISCWLDHPKARTFESVIDRNRLVLAKWDDHTNAWGDRMLADALI